jgi:hypothetical protein
VREALHRIGAARPSWQAGQPSYTDVYDGWSLTEYRYCQNPTCGKLLTEAATNTNGIARKYCSKICGIIVYESRVARGMETVSRVKYLAKCAARSEQTRIERAKNCEACGEIFFPGENGRHDDRRFCSTGDLE